MRSTEKPIGTITEYKPNFYRPYQTDIPHTWQGTSYHYASNDTPMTSVASSSWIWRSKKVSCSAIAFEGFLFLYSSDAPQSKMVLTQNKKIWCSYRGSLREHIGHLRDATFGQTQSVHAKPMLIEQAREHVPETRIAAYVTSQFVAKSSQF